MIKALPWVNHARVAAHILILLGENACLHRTSVRYLNRCSGATYAEGAYVASHSAMLASINAASRGVGPAPAA